MPEDFDDEVRRALGRPTKADLVAQEEARAKAAQALKEDEPRRAALRSQCSATIVPLIKKAFQTVAQIAQEAGIQIGEAQHTGYGAGALWTTSFHIVRANKSTGRLDVNPLWIELELDGKVRIFIQAGQSSPPYQPINFKSKSFSMDDPKAEKIIQNSFVEYLALYREAAENQRF